MTKKRFTSIIYQDVLSGVSDGKEKLTVDECCNLLNTLNDENEKLKQSYAKLKHRHSLLHDVCIEAECDRDWYQKDVSSLEKENEQLKKELKRCKDWINSDKNDYELTLAFIKNKGYSLKDVLEYEKELKSE